VAEQAAERAPQQRSGLAPSTEHPFEEVVDVVVDHLNGGAGNHIVKLVEEHTLPQPLQFRGRVRKRFGGGCGGGGRGGSEAGHGRE